MRSGRKLRKSSRNRHHARIRCGACDDQRIEHFLDVEQLATEDTAMDSVFYDRARRVLVQEQEKGPVFLFVYLAMNHFPWDYRYRPDLLPEWRNPGNPFEIDEYLRRQELSVRDYSEFKAMLAREFKGQQFLLVRFGDHQPFFAKRFLEPGLDPSGIGQRINDHDARYSPPTTRWTG